MTAIHKFHNKFHSLSIEQQEQVLSAFCTMMDGTTSEEIRKMTGLLEFTCDNIVNSYKMLLD